MDWPHDPDGDEGSEEGRKYGLAVIAKKLDDDRFPMTRSDCLEQFGDHPIRLDADTVESAETLLEHMDEGPFETREALLAAAGESMRAGGHWTFETARYG